MDRSRVSLARATSSRASIAPSLDELGRLLRALVADRRRPRTAATASGCRSRTNTVVPRWPLVAFELVLARARARRARARSRGARPRVRAARACSPALVCFAVAVALAVVVERLIARRIPRHGSTHRCAPARRGALVLAGVLGLVTRVVARRSRRGPARAAISRSRSRCRSRSASRSLALGAAELAWIWLVPAAALALAPRLARRARASRCSRPRCRSCSCSHPRSSARRPGTASCRRHVPLAAWLVASCSMPPLAPSAWWLAVRDRPARWGHSSSPWGVDSPSRSALRALPPSAPRM